jgi:hypothetical protein
MTTSRIIGLIVLAVVPAQGLHAEDSPATEWQKRIDREGRSDFDAGQGSILGSLRDYQGKCQIHLIYDPAKCEELTLKFVHDGKEVLSLEGHFYSVFCVDANILYFAEFRWAGCGCALAAYDLNTGRKLWRTELKGVGLFDHSLYRNYVNMELAQGVVCVRGYEDGGDYIEIMDRKTGKTLAHRAFASKPRGGRRKQE